MNPLFLLAAILLDVIARTTCVPHMQREVVAWLIGRKKVVIIIQTT
jgi:hypothetical protein